MHCYYQCLILSDMQNLSLLLLIFAVMQKLALLKNCLQNRLSFLTLQILLLSYTLL